MSFGVVSLVHEVVQRTRTAGDGALHLSFISDKCGCLPCTQADFRNSMLHLSAD
jgi:hypothetical protein